MTHQERGQRGMMVRLAREPWTGMTEAARNSPNHISSSDRWYRKACELNPDNTPEQNARLAEMLRTEHFREMGRRSAQSKKLAKQAKAELGDVDEPAA